MLLSTCARIHLLKHPFDSPVPVVWLHTMSDFCSFQYRHHQLARNQYEAGVYRSLDLPADGVGRDLDAASSSANAERPNSTPWLYLQPSTICHDVLYGISEYGQRHSWAGVRRPDTCIGGCFEFHLRHCRSLVVQNHGLG